MRGSTILKKAKVKYGGARQALEIAAFSLRYPKHIFANVRYFVIFMGNAHSGHSVVGALLDAHPRMVIANELHALRELHCNECDKYRLFRLILENSRMMSTKKIRTNTGYNYNIPHFYQGRFERLEVIGDKKGGASSVYYRRHPEVLEKLIQIFGSTLKVIHVVRNPYDNISAYAYRMGQKVNAAIIERFFWRADAVMDFRSRLNREQFYTLHYHDLIRNKVEKLHELCCFLGQKTDDHYLEACSKALYDSPHKRRYETEWNNEARQKVESYIRFLPYSEIFGRYSF